MYNLLIKYAPFAWEDVEGDMDLRRFYGGHLEPDDDFIGWSEPDTLRDSNLQRLVGLPTLLMYERGTPGSHAGLVRFGRMTSIERYGKVLSFNFEPDSEHGYLARQDVMRFAKHLNIDRSDSNTHWAVHPGRIPPALIKLGKSAPPQQTIAELETELREARDSADDLLVRALELRLTKVPRAGQDALVAPQTGPPFRRVVAVVVGIEQYNVLGGAGLTKVDFARADANAFLESLKEIHGKLLEEPVLLLDSDATHSTIRDELAYRIGALGEDDLFVFYYAGHGYHAVDGNRLTAADSNAYRLETTTLPLEEILTGPLRQRGARRALAFIDACAVDLAGHGRDVVANLDPAELSAFLNAADYSAIFLSCRPGEKSYSSPSLKQGIWTYHLLRALRGEEADAARDGYVTDSSLKDYLAMAVPRFVREKTQIKGHQTPQAAVRATSSFEISRLKAPAVEAPQSLRERSAKAVDYAKTGGANLSRGKAAVGARLEDEPGVIGEVMPTLEALRLFDEPEFIPLNDAGRWLYDNGEQWLKDWLKKPEPFKSITEHAAAFVGEACDNGVGELVASLELGLKPEPVKWRDLHHDAFDATFDSDKKLPVNPLVRRSDLPRILAYYKNPSTPPEPVKVQRDKPFAEAVAYVAGGEWGKRPTDLVLQGRDYRPAQTWILQAHADGRLTLWGRQLYNAVWEVIEPDHWKAHRLRDSVIGHGDPVTETRATRLAAFEHLMVSRAEVEAEWRSS